MTAVTTKERTNQNDGADSGSQPATSLNADCRKAESKRWLCNFRASVLALLSESARRAELGQDRTAAVGLANGFVQGCQDFDRCRN
jgi:hypothetical protein